MSYLTILYAKTLFHYLKIRVTFQARSEIYKKLLPWRLSKGVKPSRFDSEDHVYSCHWLIKHLWLKNNKRLIIITNFLSLNLKFVVLHFFFPIEKWRNFFRLFISTGFRNRLFQYDIYFGATSHKKLCAWGVS